MHNELIAIIFGLGSALTIAWGTVIRHRLSSTIPSGASTSAGVHRVIASPIWWAGVLLAMTGYALQIAALAFGTLLLVQPLLVLKLMFTLPLAAKFSGQAISRGELFWASVLTGTVAIIVISGRPLPGEASASIWVWLPAFLVGTLIFALLYWTADHSPRRRKALLLGVATGWLYGFVAVLSKAVVDVYTHQGLSSMVLSWELWLLIFLSLAGVWVQQAAFNAASLEASLPSMTSVEPIVAFVLGYLLLGERFQAAGLEWILLLGAMAAMVWSVAELSRRSV